MADTSAQQLERLQTQALEHTQQALEYMAQFGVRPEGQVNLFLPPSTRQHDIHRLPYEHAARQVVMYETEPSEFSALCPFSGLPDFGTLRVEYVPGSWIVELKSLKYYLLSWRNIGVAQEDVTALIYADLHRHLDDVGYLVVTTVYNVRGGINTTCTVDSRQQCS
ncbi:MAG: preQ(1) synthase [Bacteroidota bacterium]